MKSEYSILIRKLPDNRIVIFAETPYGLEPVLLFPNQEEFTKFSMSIDEFQNRQRPHITDVPIVFEQAFTTEE